MRLLRIDEAERSSPRNPSPRNPFPDAGPQADGSFQDETQAHLGMCVPGNSVLQIIAFEHFGVVQVRHPPNLAPILIRHIPRPSREPVCNALLPAIWPTLSCLILHAPPTGH